MAVRHVEKPIFGLQFHPESVATQFGDRIAQNFINLASLHRTFQLIHRPIPHSPQTCSLPFRTLVRSVQLCVTPLALFKSVYGNAKHSFWLDSSTNATTSRCSSPSGEEQCVDLFDAHPARYSMMGTCEGPFSELVTYNVSRRITTVRKQKKKETFDISVFDYLKKGIKSHQAEQNPELPIEMNGGYVGFFGYEMKYDVDGAIENVHTSHLPDAWFIFADRLLVVDHRHDRLYLVALARNGNLEDYRDAKFWFESIFRSLDTVLDEKVTLDNPRSPIDTVWMPLQFHPERSRSQYLSDIQRCLRYIHNGDSYEVCLTNRLRTTLPNGFKSDPLELYSALRIVNPSPFSAYLRLDDDQAVCCSSPERYLHISSSGEVESKPIKGTLPRGQTLEEDIELRDQLQNSPKDRSENLMIVDLVRNDLSRMCEVGSVTVPKLMCVESYATVHQLVSTVRGKLTCSSDAIDCVRAAYPMGSMTGAPKVRTMEIIDRLEKSARGIYSGSIGYLSVCGAVDLNVVIRTAVLNGSRVEIGVGGAIVAMSNPKDEYEETILKGMAIMKALTLNVTGSRNVLVVHEPYDDAKIDDMDEA
ncbi:ADC synthase [Gracilaria domingensis]|nr:ADC synthase [Gracilaria domingensis]